MSSRVGLVVFIATLALSGAQEKSSLIGRTHRGFEKALDFALVDYQQLNLDSLYGITLAHGFLENILQLNLTEKDFIIVSNYKEKIEKIVRLVKPSLFNYDADNNLFVENLIDLKRWNRQVIFQENMINPNFRPNNYITSKDFVKFESLSNFNERRSDECILDILRSGSYKVPHICNINKWCNKNMINNQNIKPAYVITHRLLLLQIAKTQNCIFSRKQFDDKIRSYCSHIYWEVLQNEKFGFIPTLDDLLMEQITLCGAEGFAEFTRRELIEYVLSIESEHGCFSVALMTRTPTRSKRTANYIKYGCNDHSTGLGISTMSLFLLSLYQSGETL